jgi:aspartoacylase
MEAKLPDTLYEAKRSKELKQLIANPNDTFVIDLHTTTSNMGVSWIFPLSDKTSWAIGADSARNTPNSYLLETEKQDDETGFVNRIANQSVTIEVGPVPQNVYLAESILITKNAVMNALIAVQKWNSGKIQDSESWCYRETGWIDYPRDSAGKIKAVIHPDFQGKDYKEIIYGDPLFLGFDGKVYLSEAQESFWPVFINEAAYYEKGIAFLTTKKFKKI